MSRSLALLCATLFALSLAGQWPLTASAGEAGAARSSPRIEARSANFLAVGIVHDDRMSIHLSRLIDNAPVRDAALTVLLRGVLHPTLAEADGSYTLQTHDLELPGPASLEFEVQQGQGHENLKGAIPGAAGAIRTDDKNSARQLWWWALNFVVCIGFLLLWSRRRKSAAQD